MKPEEIRIAIAEACGKTPKLDWQVMNPDESASCFSGSEIECKQWFSDHLRRFPESRYKDWHVGAWKRYPDYLNDLNACHEMEKVLAPAEQHNYGNALALSVLAPERAYFAESTDDDPNLNGFGHFALATVTAAQRCEEFLKTIGKWNES